MSERAVDKRTEVALSKVDHSLRKRLLEDVDVYVRLHPTAEVADVARAMERNGYEVRHVMARFSAITASVPVGALANLTQWPDIEALEEPQSISLYAQIPPGGGDWGRAFQEFVRQRQEMGDRWFSDVTLSDAFFAGWLARTSNAPATHPDRAVQNTEEHP